MFNVTEDKSQSPNNIIECSNAEKSKYDDYLAISVFKLLSYVDVVDAWLGESGENFVWRWAILDNPPPYWPCWFIRSFSLSVKLCHRRHGFFIVQKLSRL